LFGIYLAVIDYAWVLFFLCFMLRLIVAWVNFFFSLVLFGVLFWFVRFGGVIVGVLYMWR
ncbi:hypothetical protein ACQWFR_25010, partial [Salmonella enterica subsp. enterica serovar Infantis]